jgi:hypothetical protein
VTIDEQKVALLRRAYCIGDSIQKAAKALRIGIGTAHRYYRRFATSGLTRPKRQRKPRQPKPYGNRPYIGDAWLGKPITKQPDPVGPAWIGKRIDT